MSVTPIAMRVLSLVTRAMYPPAEAGEPTVARRAPGHPPGSAFHVAAQAGPSPSRVLISPTALHLVPSQLSSKS